MVAEKCINEMLLLMPMPLLLTITIIMKSYKILMILLIRVCNSLPINGQCINFNIIRCGTVIAFALKG